MTLGGARGDNYTVTLPANNVAVTGGITKKDISINTVAPPVKNYDGLAAATAGAVTFTGEVAGHALSLNTDYSATAEFTGGNYNAGTGKSYTYTVTMLNTVRANNYNLAAVTRTGADGVINKINYTGTTTASTTVIAGEATTGNTVTLPPLPLGGVYAARDNPSARSIEIGT